MSQVLVYQNVPADKVAELEENLRNLGATDVEKTAQGDKFTLRATFPDAPSPT